MIEFLGELLGEIIICGTGACIRYVFFFLIGRKKSFSKLLESDGYNMIIGALTIAFIVFMTILINI